MKELTLRIVSGVILGAAVLFITFWHADSFAMMCGLAALVLFKEWYGLTKTRGALWLIGGGLYIGAAIASLIALRYQQGPLFIVFILLLVWASDIGGYAVGKPFGKHKIAPAISPGKSWEGLVGSIAFVAATLLFLNRISPIWWPWWVFPVIGTAISVLGLAGDMFESWLKRRAGVKDSGKLIPGHGGLFDRVDALMPVSIFLGIFYFALPALVGK